MKKLSLVLGFALFTAFLSFAQNQTINFDNAPQGNAGVIDGVNFAGWFISNVNVGGYANNKTSQPNTALSPFEATPLSFTRTGDPFSLVSVQLGAGWNCGMNLRITGFIQGGQIFEEDVTVDATAPATDWQPGWTVDEVTVTRTSPGNLCVGGGAGAHYLMDDLVIGPPGEILKPLSGGTSVPTMTQWGLFLFGLIVVTLGVVYIYNMSVRTSTIEE